MSYTSRSCKLPALFTGAQGLIRKLLTFVVPALFSFYFGGIDWIKVNQDNDFQARVSEVLSDDNGQYNDN